jgi:Flp pilus assembly protein TadD
VLDYGIPRALVLSDVLPGLALIGALIAVTLVALWRRPALGFLGAWFFITLAPASSFVPVATEVGAERRMYLPLMALVMLAVLAVDALIARVRTAPAGGSESPAGRPAVSILVPAGVLVVVCTLMVTGIVLRNREYRSRLTIAQTIVERWPNGRGHFLVASEFVAAGRHDEAMAEFRESSKDFPGALFALGTELIGAGDVVEGTAALEAYIKAQPDNTLVIPAREALSTVYLNEGRLDLAGEQLRLLLARVPNNAGARRLMGDLRMKLNDPAQAVVEYRESLRVRPGQVDTLGNLGYALAALNRFDEAADAMRQVVVLTPGNPEAHMLLGRVLAVLKKYDDARSEFQAAVELDPGNRDAKTNLESVERLLARTGSATSPAARQ